jgi:subfamily B ATP-binding cassette protein MsbA
MRLLGYARPYLALVGLGILFALLYAGGVNLRAYMIKPLLDDVLMQQVEGDLSVSDLFSGITGDGGGPAPADSDPSTGVSQEEREATWEAVRKGMSTVILLSLLILIVLPLSHFGKDYVVNYTLGRVLVDIQQDLCVKLLSLPLRFHHGRDRGDTLSRVMNDVRVAHLSLDRIFIDVVQGALSILAGVALLLYISWQLTVLSFTLAPVLIGVIAVFGKRIRKSARRRQESQGDVTQRLLQVLSGIKVIQSFRAEAFEASGFRRQNRKLFRHSMKVVMNRVLSRSLAEGVNNAIGLIVLVVGAFVVLKQIWGLTPGSLAAFVAVLAGTYRPVKDLTKGWTQLMDAVPAAERFFELLDEPPALVDAPDAVAIEGVDRGIRFSKVSFSYGRDFALRDVSLDIAAGEVVALVGPTGSGKTTLADLLLRLYEPDSGCIEIDGLDLLRIRRDSLLDHVAVVTQEPFLFTGTIGDNIRYGRPDSSPEEVERAARIAHVDEFVTTLPHGYDTEVGEAGVNLSGGQRQRITIARAILKDPSILIFDEATSSLDARSERFVQDAMESLLSGRTVLVIAHRLSTVRHADKIVVLEAGVVSASGTHEELMQGDGLYRELIALQNSSG